MASTLRVVLIFVLVLAAGALVGSAVTQWTPGGVAADSVGVQRQFGERVRVEVLNAGGRPNMARRAVDILRSRGFDVVYFGNAESFGQESSRVVDRVGRVDAARAVADALEIDVVESETDRDLYLDVTVRLGLDWDPQAAFEPAQMPDSAEWWDPEGLLRKLRGR